MSKIITVIVKVAGLVITAPVTWGIAMQVFSDMPLDNLPLLVQVVPRVSFWCPDWMY